MFLCADCHPRRHPGHRIVKHTTCSVCGRLDHCVSCSLVVCETDALMKFLSEPTTVSSGRNLLRGEH